MLPIVIYFCFSFAVHGQIICGDPWPKENLQPDTVSTFLFLNKSLKVTSFENAIPTSNFSFTTKSFDLIWAPIVTGDITKFIDRSLKSMSRMTITDTITCKIFGLDHKAIVMKSKRKMKLLIFQNQNGTQYIFYATIHNKNKIKQTIEYLETNLLGEK